MAFDHAARGAGHWTGEPSVSAGGNERADAGICAQAREQRDVCGLEHQAGDHERERDAAECGDPLRRRAAKLAVLIRRRERRDERLFGKTPTELDQSAYRPFRPICFYENINLALEREGDFVP